MSFKEFDMSEYISALEDFKARNEEDVIKHWGSIEKFDQFIQKVKADQPKLAQLAIKQFGSVEKYTQAMKYNLEHFSELMERADQLKENKDEVLSRSDALFRELIMNKIKIKMSHALRCRKRWAASSPTPVQTTWGWIWARAFGTW